MSESRLMCGKDWGKEDCGGQGSAADAEGTVGGTVVGEESLSFSANVLVGGPRSVSGCWGGFAASSDNGKEANGFLLVFESVVLDMEKGFAFCCLVDGADAPKREEPRSAGVWA